MTANDIPSRSRPATKKALLVGIGYKDRKGEDGQELEYLPSSFSNVTKFRAFLQGGDPSQPPILQTYTIPCPL
jgi:hypothetical protein